jgi:6-phosphofructokinase 2
MVAVTLGHEGAILVRREGVIDCPALEVEAKSTVGAGDSFLAAMVFALCNGESEEAAFRFGMAAGTAAVLHPGTDLARPADIARLLPQLATA